MSDLMKTRYRVIAGYPNSPFKIGEVLTTEEGTDKRLYSKGNGFYVNAEVYPHLFKKLEWWEERELSEMPEYVKWGFMVYKVRKWAFEKVDDTFVMYAYTTSTNGFSASVAIPSTHTEYLNQKK